MDGEAFGFQPRVASSCLDVQEPGQPIYCVRLMFDILINRFNDIR